MKRTEVATYLLGVFGLANVVNALSFVAAAGVSLASGLSLLGGLAIVVVTIFTIHRDRFDDFETVADSDLLFWALVVSTVGFSTVVVVRLF